MMKNINGFFRKLILSGYSRLFDVVIFAILLIFVHFAYIWWSSAGFPPIKHLIDKLFAFASVILFEQSVWIVQNLFGVDITTQGQTIFFSTLNNQQGFVAVDPGCTSLKQWVHWIVLMILFPGPWKHKIWYIPAGVVVIHFVNLVRITGLVATTIPFPLHFDFFHNYIFKTFFYFMIFVMWVIWVEFFRNKSKRVTDAEVMN